MKYLKSFLSFFTVITTAILIVVTIDTIISGYENLPPYITLQIIGAGAFTALITVIVYSIEFKSKAHFLIMTVIHYIVLCGVMSVLGILFGWINSSIGGIGVMCIYVAVVYVIVYVMTYIIAKKEADELNRALNERNNKN